MQGSPRQRIDERGISSLLGDSFVKFPIADGICFHVVALQGYHSFTKHISNRWISTVAHLGDGKLDGKTFQALV